MPKVKYPATDDELEAAGYLRRLGPFGLTRCGGRKCQATIEWWTTPKKKAIPMHRLGDGKLQPHFADCPDSPAFRR